MQGVYNSTAAARKVAYAEFKRPLLKEKLEMSNQAAKLGMAALNVQGTGGDPSSIIAQTRDAIQGKALFNAKYKDRTHFKYS